MENILENKAKFFAVYYGQAILSYSNHTYHNVVDCNVLINSNHNLKHAVLNVIPLSSITDEDAEIISRYAKHDIYAAREIYELIKNLDDTWVQDFNHEEIIFAFDYLRSKCYALPWMGLSVEKQIEYGWVKLIV